jgi:hypothetical protein
MRAIATYNASGLWQTSMLPNSLLLRKQRSAAFRSFCSQWVRSSPYNLPFLQRRFALYLCKLQCLLVGALPRRDAPEQSEYLPVQSCC